MDAVGDGVTGKRDGKRNGDGAIVAQPFLVILDNPFLQAEGARGFLLAEPERLSPTFKIFRFQNACPSISC